MRIRGRMLVALACCMLACGEREGTKATPAAAPAPAALPAAPSATAAGDAARQIFTTRCVTCHGSAGAGDGPGSAALDPKPRNFQDAVWQDSVTDEHLEQIVMYGGVAVGKSPSMPGNPDLISQPEVVRALVAHLRSLAGRS